MPSFHHNGIRLEYLDTNPNAGADECALLFVHGAGSSSEIWEFQVEEFSPTHRVLATDLSGHGKSQTGKDSVSIKGYSEEILALVDHLGLERYLMVGHSMGGAATLSYTLLPPRVMPLGLVLVGTSPDLKFGKIAPGLAIEALEYQFGLFRSSNAKKESRVYQIKKREEEARRKNPAVFQGDLQACNAFDICNRVNEIRLPTFCVVGEDDDIIKPAVMARFERQLPRADFAVVPNSDHCPMLENAPHFNRILRDFIECIAGSE
jgi:pimeloyl-ACP methyl ester carboxylesterase